MNQAANDRLAVFTADRGLFFVDSADGKSLYKVLGREDGSFICSCPDYAKKSTSDPEYRCIHIRAVLDADHKGEVTSHGRKKPKLAEEFIKQIDGKDFVLYSGLLDLAHQKGLRSLEVEVLQFPTKENDNLVVCRATAISQNGESFIDFGDANLVNCNPKVGKHLIRMASTRAKARALRDFTNIGITCLEELGDLNEVIGEEQGKRPQKQPLSRKAVEETPKPERQRKEPPARKAPEPAEPSSAPSRNPESTPPLSEAQRRAILNLSKRRGIPEEQVERMARDQFGTSFSHLSSKDASSFIRTLQQAA